MAVFDQGKAEQLAQDAPVLVSACLLGELCRYDGHAAANADVAAFARGRKAVAVCPEQLGGLPTPRVPSERVPDGRVMDAQGVDRTEAFVLGAQRAVEIAREHGCKLAVLKAKSPSCGVSAIYDGSFSGTLVAGEGIAAAALREAGLDLLEV